MANEYVIGVDIGTGSARVGVFDLHGEMVSSAEQEIRIWYPHTDFVEQSSEDIWRAVCGSVKQALLEGGVQPGEVAGISFDATCSLVVLGPGDEPVTVSPSGSAEQNIIVWMDHRAIEQAERINAKGHGVLQYVGGKISPEQQIPKLLWLKENIPNSWNNAALFLDLADFLTYRASGKNVRSLCTTVCKWTYLGHEGRWDRSFFEQVGLEELLEGEKIGAEVLPMGECLGNLTEKSAAELGLTTATRVGVGIIDAHAGGVGLIGMEHESVPEHWKMEQVLCLIGGTSSCHMAVSQDARYVPGVWGPYFSAMVPGMWLTEGGQSATGALIDYVIRDSGENESLRQLAEDEDMTVYEYLNRILLELSGGDEVVPDIARNLHVLPYFLGNRSPHADPTPRGAFCGLSLDNSIEALATKYYATVQAVAYGTRHIIAKMNENGYGINRIYGCGGGTKNPVWLQEHADITGCEIILPQQNEAMLLGGAILAAVAAGKYKSLLEAGVNMSAPGKRYLPRPETNSFHKAKYQVFSEMYRHSQMYESIMEV